MQELPSAPNARPRYRWPWFVLGAFVAAIALAILWMSVAVRRTRQLRDSNPLVSTPAADAPGTSAAPTNRTTGAIHPGGVSR
ncbi:MAG TPA: hypothetical protein VFD66_01000 [Verrucomicrobiae bacterium]|nr:hypothetical protein [Verrucomicrobiae bacterium]